MAKIRQFKCPRISTWDLFKLKKPGYRAEGTIETFDLYKQPLEIKFLAEIYADKSGSLQIRYRGLSQTIKTYHNKGGSGNLFRCQLGCNQKVETLYLSTEPYFGCIWCLNLSKFRPRDFFVEKLGTHPNMLKEYLRTARTSQQKKIATKAYFRFIFNFKKSLRLGKSTLTY